MRAQIKGLGAVYSWKFWCPALLICALVAGIGCADEAAQVEVENDPMEMKRHYLSPSQNYQLNSAVRWVAPVDEDGEPEPLIIGSNVYQLPPTLREGARIEDDRVSLPLKGRGYLKNREIGDIVVLKGERSPWRRIVAIHQVDGRIEWETKRANIQEVFEHAHFHLQVDTSRINPNDLPEVDLADPYLHPEDTPELVTRQFASEQRCPVPPKCEPITEEACIFRDNPEVLCEIPGIESTIACEDLSNLAESAGLGKCALRRAPGCVVADDPGRACPEDKMDTCGEPNGYCKKDKHWGVSFGSKTFQTYRNIGGKKLKNISDFSCEDYAGEKYMLMHTRRGDDPYCDAPTDCGADESEGVTCKDTLYSGACEQEGASCSEGADCCSGHCQAGQCVANERGYCAEACVRESASGESNVDGIGDKIVDMLDKVSGGQLSSIGLETLNVEAKFKPEITIDIKIEYFTLDRVTLGLGADYFLKFGLNFNFEKTIDKEIGTDKNFPIFPFAILGYPFSIDLLLSAKVYARVSAIGKFNPAFYLYSYRPEDDELWKDVEGAGFPENADENLPVPALKSNSSGSAGFRMGMMYSKSDPCPEYPSSDGYTCSRVGSSKFYTYRRNQKESFFDPGVEGSLDVRAGAQAGLGVGLIDRGLTGGSLLIGIDPINLLAKAYAAFDPPLCGLGFGLYYRIFVKTGELRLLGIKILSKKDFAIYTKRIFGLDYDIPNSFLDEDSEDGACREGSGWACTLADLLDCGVMPDEPEPSTAGLPCADHAACTDEPEHRCIAGQCIEAQPDGSLRISVTWQTRQNFNLKIRTPDGRTITRGATNEGATFADTCGDPSGDCGQSRLEFTESVSLDTSAASPGDVYTFWVGTDSQVDPSQSVNVDFEVEQDGEPVHSFSTYFSNQDRFESSPGRQGQAPGQPMKFEYTLK